VFIGAAQHDTRTSSADKLAGSKVFGQKEAVLKAGENGIMRERQAKSDTQPWKCRCTM
jgi:hypothetical protein